jgi:signal transduction histidine kinase
MDAAWKISVIDHGRGFDYAENGEQQQGNGLMNITQRAADSDFGLEIIAAAGQGTRVSVILRH